MPKLAVRTLREVIAPQYQEWAEQTPTISAAQQAIQRSERRFYQSANQVVTGLIKEIRRGGLDMTKKLNNY